MTPEQIERLKWFRDGIAGPDEFAAVQLRGDLRVLLAEWEERGRERDEAKLDAAEWELEAVELKAEIERLKAELDAARRGLAELSAYTQELDERVHAAEANLLNLVEAGNEMAEWIDDEKHLQVRVWRAALAAAQQKG